MIEAFLVSPASLGARFANPQEINGVISNGTYSPGLQRTYWTRWVMVVISGIVLAQIVYDFFLHSANDTTAQAAPTAIGQPLPVLIAGYSVDFVHRILQRAIIKSASSSVPQWTAGSAIRQVSNISDAEGSSHV
jgi:hypothetical protein